MHCFKHKIFIKIFAKKGEEETKKNRVQQKMVMQKEGWKSSIQNGYDKKKNEQAQSKSSTMMVMNDSMRWKKQETLNPKPKDYMDQDFTKKVEPKIQQGILNNNGLGSRSKLESSTCKWFQV